MEKSDSEDFEPPVRVSKLSKKKKKNKEDGPKKVHTSTQNDDVDLTESTCMFILINTPMICHFL